MGSFPKTQVIIAAGGSGKRFQSGRPKLFVEINGRAVIARTLDAFEKSSCVEKIILVGNAGYWDMLKDLIRKEKYEKILPLVEGGATRCASVRNGLKALGPDARQVIVHDGARPLITSAFIDAMVKVCPQGKAMVAAVPVKATIKRVRQGSMAVQETLPRQDLWEIQTPQIFPRKILDRAHAQNKDENVTDDAVLLERMGIGVEIFPADYKNIKITTEEDIRVAEVFCSNLLAGKVE